MLTRLERPWNGFKSSSHKTGKTIRSFLWPLNYFNAKLHDLRTLLHIAMIYQSIVHCIACYSNLHMYTFIHAGYCRISCTSSNIYTIGILKCTCIPPVPMRVLLSISLWIERSSPHTIPLGNAMAMDMWWWICESWEGSAASHPDAAQQGNQLLQFGELKDGA